MTVRSVDKLLSLRRDRRSREPLLWSGGTHFGKIWNPRNSKTLFSAFFFIRYAFSKINLVQLGIIFLSIFSSIYRENKALSSLVYNIQVDQESPWVVASQLALEIHRPRKKQSRKWCVSSYLNLKNLFKACKHIMWYKYQ